MAGMTAANANRQSVFRIFIVLKGFGLMVIEQNYNEGNRIYCNGKKCGYKSKYQRMRCEAPRLTQRDVGLYLVLKK